VFACSGEQSPVWIVPDIEAAERIIKALKSSPAGYPKRELLGDCWLYSGSYVRFQYRQQAGSSGCPGHHDEHTPILEPPLSLTWRWIHYLEQTDQL